MIRQLLRYCTARARRLLIAELALVLVSAVLQGVAFLLLVPLLRATFDGDIAVMMTMIVIEACVVVAYAVAAWTASHVGMTATSAVLESLLEQLGDRLVELPVSWFSADRSGFAVSIATQGAMFVASAPTLMLSPILAGFVTPGTVLIGMWFIDWRIAVAMTVMVPVLALGYRWIQRATGRGDADHSTAVADASSRVIEFARLQQTLRTAGKGSVADQLVSEALAKQHHAYRGMLLGGGAGMATFTGLVQLSITVILALGAFLAVGGTVDPATLIGLLVLGVRFNEPIVNAGNQGSGIAVARTTLDQLDRLTKVAVLPEPTEPRAPEHYGVEFRDVTFGYGANPVLRDLSFTAPAGGMTAIVGPSGSGKTTITKLIARFYDPESGTVSIGGVPLAEMGTAAIEAAVAPVFQDVYLFDDTILGNIWIGNPDVPREAVIATATRARVDEIVERLPGGWDANVGEGGSNLSGGERQRISIARALLKDAPIVLLDEATSALDIGNEIAIGDTIERARAGRTMIVVAHRLQTIMTADHIIMLDDEGGIREAGTHADLIAANGTYARYWRERVDAAGWRLTASPHTPLALRKKETP